MGTSLSFSDKAILAKIEGTEDTDSTPDGSNFIRTKNCQINIYDGDTYAPAYDGDGGRDRPEYRTNEHNTLSFDVDATGSGVAGTPPAHGLLLRACGLKETIDPGVSVVYQLEDTLQDSVSVYFLRGEKQLYRTTGVRGKLGMALTDRVPDFKFSEFKGSYHRPEVPGGIVPALSNQADAVPLSTDNTQILTFDGEALCLSDFSIDSFGNSVSRNDYVGCRGTGLSPESSRGSMTILAPDLATKNWFQAAESHQGLNKVPFALSHGPVGNNLGLTCTEVQALNVQETDVDGELGYSMDLIFITPLILTFT